MCLKIGESYVDIECVFFEVLKVGRVGDPKHQPSATRHWCAFWFLCAKKCGELTVSTPPKTNMDTRNDGLEYYFPIGKAYFQGLC